jgi:hypothetical protein
MRSASCQRKLGEFAEAIKTYETILKEKNTMVNVQVEASYTYQEWAAADKEGKYYFHAIMGGENKLSGKNKIIWGWGEMSQKTARLPAFRDTFLEARYNLAYSRYHRGLLNKDKSERESEVTKSKRDIFNVSFVVQDYGGEKWRDKFDALLKQMQTSLKEKPVGLKEFAPNENASVK